MERCHGGGGAVDGGRKGECRERGGERRWSRGGERRPSFGVVEGGFWPWKRKGMVVVMEEEGGEREGD